MATTTRKTPARVELSDILAAILDGVCDDDFDRMFDAVKERRQILDAKKRTALKVGDRVRFNDVTRPAYLRGEHGTVTGFKQSRVSVKLDRAMGRYGNAEPITTPVSLIEKL